MLGLVELIQLQLTIKLLLEILNQKAHLPHIVFELIVLNFEHGELLLGLLELELLRLHLLLVLIEYLLELDRFSLFVRVLLLELLDLSLQFLHFR